MSDKENGGPAFPQNDLSAYNMGPDGIGDGMGMTLRDWFAGRALASLPISGAASDAAIDGAANVAYRIADAMLAARK